jgi:predicted Rossmann fold flavoprotein
VFPISDKAVDIVDALADFAKGATFYYSSVCKKLNMENGVVTGVTLEDGQEIKGDSVVIATGGLSYPTTGSTGDGYALAKSAGHTITELIPSLVPVVCHTTDCRDLMGLSLKNVTFSVTDKASNRLVYSELGEMLFTHFGLSGPLVLSASAHLRPMEKKRYFASIDMKPALDEAQLDARLLRDFEANIHRTLRNSLGKLLPAKMIPVVIKRSQIKPDTKVNQITKEQRKALVGVIKKFTFEIDGFRPIEEAIVTAGGVQVQEINPKTMESKLCKGLFFAGEVLDLDAYTGGFNLQIAFSTGYLAGLYS